MALNPAPPEAAVSVADAGGEGAGAGDAVAKPTGGIAVDRDGSGDCRVSKFFMTNRGSSARATRTMARTDP